MHTHTPFATVLARLVGGRRDPARRDALRYCGRTAYDEEYSGLVLDDAEGERSCAMLEGADVLFMASHGVMVTGKSVASTFDDLC